MTTIPISVSEEDPVLSLQGTVPTISSSDIQKNETTTTTTSSTTLTSNTGSVVPTGIVIGIDIGSIVVFTIALLILCNKTKATTLTTTTTTTDTASVIPTVVKENDTATHSKSNNIKNHKNENDNNHIDHVANTLLIQYMNRSISLKLKTK
jgi:hypothetical protein